MPLSRLAKSLSLAFFLLTGCAAQVKNIDTATADDTSENVTWVAPDCGGEIGDHPCDFTFLDQNGNDWNLHEHYGKTILLDFSTMWCGYCRVSAEDVQAVQDEYGDRNFLWVTLLVDDASGGDVSLDEVQLWSNTYGITTAPVLAADRSIIDPTAENGYPVTSWPMFILVDQEMNIIWGLKGWSQQLVLEAIEDKLEQ